MSQAILRGLSALVTLIDCIVLANREASRNPYHPLEYNPSGALGSSSSVGGVYGWGAAGAPDAFYHNSMLPFLVWDLLVSAFISAEIWGRHWHVVASFLERLVASFLERLGLARQEARAARLPAEEEKEEKDTRSGEELERDILQAGLCPLFLRHTRPLFRVEWVSFFLYTVSLLRIAEKGG
jgi:hypothetical protein